MKKLVLVLALLAAPSLAAAHPAPFSYLDLRIGNDVIEGALVVHIIDVAHDLGIAAPEKLLDRSTAYGNLDRLTALVAQRLMLRSDQPLTMQWGDVDTLPERQGVQLHFRIHTPRPATLGIHALMFPYDRLHQTFVNVYEDGALRQQFVLSADNPDRTYYSGTTQGAIAVIKTFVPAGIHHILIGPDHILFLIGLLLLGGTFARLALIVTSFTIGHSITLSLAALNVFSPPARIVEPLIALTIIVVGADNLLVLRQQKNDSVPSEPSAALETAVDLRPWLAVAFGLIHGFGFAYVLKEFGLPQAALGWSLFAFNLGVEIGQLLIVGAVAGVLLMARRSSAPLARTIALLGSIAVIAAGAYWFVQRVFFPA